MRCTSSRAAFQPLQPSDLLSNQNTQATKDVQGQPGHSWGLAQEAQYFAELDAEQLVEDGQEAAEVPVRRQPAVRGRTVAGQSQESKPKQKCDAEDFSSHIQTPNAVALAKYHPDLQVSLHGCINTREPQQAG